MTGLQVYGVASNGIQAIEAFARGDYKGGLDHLGDAASGTIGLRSGLRGLGNLFGAGRRGGLKGIWQYFQSCFVAGTPLRTPAGSKPIEAFRSYEECGDDCDLVLSRNEFDPGGPIVARRVLRKFVRVSPVLNLHVGGRVIGTTAEHPFYVEDDGWRPAGELRIGSRILLQDGGWLRVDGVGDSGRVETVYNLEVEDEHTYFIGCAEWGFAVWSHNVRCFHYTSIDGVKGMNGSRSIKPNKTIYTGHGVNGSVVWVTPLSPAEVAARGGPRNVLGLTRKKAALMIELDIPPERIEHIPGSRGKWIWFVKGPIRLPPKGLIPATPTGL